MRFLILLAIIVFLIFLLLNLLRLPVRQKPASKVPEKMVACAQCGLYLPESEAIAESGQCFCSREHLTVWRNEQD